MRSCFVVLWSPALHCTLITWPHLRSELTPSCLAELVPVLTTSRHTEKNLIPYPDDVSSLGEVSSALDLSSLRLHSYKRVLVE